MPYTELRIHNTFLVNVNGKWYYDRVFYLFLVLIFLSLRFNKNTTSDFVIYTAVLQKP